MPSCIAGLGRGAQHLQLELCRLSGERNHGPITVPGPAFACVQGCCFFSKRNPAERGSKPQAHSNTFPQRCVPQGRTPQEPRAPWVELLPQALLFPSRHPSLVEEVTLSVSLRAQMSLESASHRVGTASSGAGLGLSWLPATVWHFTI